MQTINHIVTPVDLGDHSEKLVDYAAYIAEKFDAKLTLLHVIEPFPTVGDLDMGGTDSMREYTQIHQKQAEKHLQKLAEKYPKSTTTILKGEIVDEIIDFAKNKETEIIIIGTHGTKGIEKLLLGSVAERVVKNAHCPTLVMNPFKQ